MRTVACILALSLASVTHAASTVPFHATINTVVAVVGGGPTTLELNITGPGEGTHVGRLQIDGPSHVDLATALQTGTSTLTAADGSSFDFSFAGTVGFTGPAPTDPVTFQGTWHVTSGTGRFEDVSGSGTYSGSASIPNGILFLDGTLSNPGKKK